MSTDDSIDQNAADASVQQFVDGLEAGPLQSAAPDTPAPEAEGSVEAGGVYRLKYGDSLESIAQELYGDPARAADILHVNQQAGILINGDALPMNQLILLP